MDQNVAAGYRTGIYPSTLEPYAQTPTAIRSRRMRDRRKWGAHLASIEIRPTARDRLVELGWLDPSMTDDKAAIAGGLVACLAAALDASIKPRR